MLVVTLGVHESIQDAQNKETKFISAAKMSLTSRAEGRENAPDLPQEVGDHRCGAWALTVMPQTITLLGASRPAKPIVLVNIHSTDHWPSRGLIPE